MVPRTRKVKISNISQGVGYNSFCEQYHSKCSPLIDGTAPFSPVIETGMVALSLEARVHK